MVERAHITKAKEATSSYMGFRQARGSNPEVVAGLGGWLFLVLFVGCLVCFVSVICYLSHFGRHSFSSVLSVLLFGMYVVSVVSCLNCLFHQCLVLLVYFCLYCPSYCPLFDLSISSLFLLLCRLSVISSVVCLIRLQSCQFCCAVCILFVLSFFLSIVSFFV